MCWIATPTTSSLVLATLMNKLLKEAKEKVRDMHYTARHATYILIAMMLVQVSMYLPNVVVLDLVDLVVKMVLLVSLGWFAYTFTGNSNRKFRRIYHLLYAITGDERYLKE